MRFTVNFSNESAQQAQKDILLEIYRYISKALDSSMTAIRSRIVQITNSALESSETLFALNGKQLATDLCINDTTIVSNIIEAVLDSISIEKIPLKVAGNSISGGIDIKILEDNFSEIISLPGGSYTTLNGFNVPWLEWLLFYGTTTLIPRGKLIQTKRGVIVGRSPTNFSLSPAHAGTRSDNFLTRAIKPLEPAIGNILEQELARRV
jgi:hypothetical protein